MSQHIDLYRDDLRPVEASGDLPRALVLGGLAVVAMLLWGGVAQWQASRLGNELEALSSEQQDLQARSTAASEALGRRVPDAALTSALVVAQQGVEGRRWLLARIDEGASEVVPFSGVLEGLGRQRPEALWLTRIHVGAAGADLGLGGRSLDAQAVPVFLQGLGGESALAGREFLFFDVARPDKAGEPLRFEMATDCEALARGCAPEGARP